LDASSVAPIKGVQLRIVVLKLKRQFITCADAATHRVTHLGLPVFEAVGQHDAGPVFLTSRRVFDGLYIRLDDTLYPGCRTPLLAIDIEVDRGEERLDPIGADSREDLKVRPPC
jgi:hypothetical protein